MLSLASTRLGDERGFTLIELMVACVIGMIVILAADMLLDNSMTLSAQTQERVDSAERGRLAMEQIARELRSEVCITPGGPAITDGEDYSVTFYVFTGGGTYVPDKHTIAWNTNTNTISESVYPGSGSYPNFSYPAQPASTRVLAQNVVAEPGNVPVFTYYAFAQSGTIAPTVQLSTPLSASDQPRVARVAIKFLARAESRSDNLRATTLEDDAYVHGWNANAPSGPTPPPCV